MKPDVNWPLALADSLVAWARTLQPELGGSLAETLRRCVAQLEAERAAGHVLLPLSAVDAARLRATGLVEEPEAEDFPRGLPLVLDAANQLYLHRDYEHEQALAARLAALLHAAPAAIAPEPLRSLFPAPAEGEIDWQALAVAQALRQRLTVISGGPGTGKTSTVLRLLACVLAAQPQARVQLAAPTGKAAQRLLEALQAGLARLPEPVQAGLREALPTQALTLHRLLGAGPQGYRQGAEAPLALDWLIVDEASMLDLALARQLLDALPPEGRLVLLGDRHQLAAVENGAVLAELSEIPSWSEATRAALADALGRPALALPAPEEASVPDLAVAFRRSHRFAADSGIGRLAAAVREGEAEQALDLLRKSGQEDLSWLPATDLDPAIARGFGPYAQALGQLWRAPNEAAEDAVWAAWERFRLLCAGHAGPWGTRALNAAAARWLRTQLPAGAPPGLGEPLLVTRNQADSGLVNGDILLLLPDAEGGLQAHLRRGAERLRLPLSHLPAELDGAFAMTVHKAQGSEFDALLLLLPDGLGWVTREWVYTGLTRARRELALLASPAALQAALAQRSQRRSGLRAQLRQRLAPG